MSQDAILRAEYGLNRYAYRTFTGRMLDLSSPNLEDICLEDIAHHLSRVCRFGGAVHDYYSVASHSVYVGRIIADVYGETSPAARAALLHDATEAYLGDMVSGLKRLNPDYKRLEGEWAHVIEARFGVHFEGCPVIKDADLRARLSECRDLFGGTYPRELLLGGEGDRQPWPAPCVPQAPADAEWSFLAACDRAGLAT